MKTVIFARVSTASQNTDRQVFELTQLCERSKWELVGTITETISGVANNEERTGLQELLALAKARKVKQVLVSEISRLGRNTLNALQIIEQLENYGVSVHVANMGLSTLDKKGKRNAMATVMLTTMASFAQMERDLLAERVKSGLAQAKRKAAAKGKKLRTRGAEKICPAKKYPQVAKLLKNGLSLRETAKLAGVSVNTVRKVKAAIKWTSVHQVARFPKSFHLCVLFSQTF